MLRYQPTQTSSGAIVLVTFGSSQARADVARALSFSFESPGALGALNLIMQVVLLVYKVGSMASSRISQRYVQSGMQCSVQASNKYEDALIYYQDDQSMGNALPNCMTRSVGSPRLTPNHTGTWTAANPCLDTITQCNHCVQDKPEHCLLR